MSEDNSEHEIIITPARVQAVHVPMTEQQLMAAIEPIPTLNEVFAEDKEHEPNKFLQSIDHELPDHSKAEVNQQQDFVAKQKVIKKVYAKAKDAAQQAANKTMSEHPEAEGLGFKFTGRVYAQKYNGVNLSQAFIHMLDCMLDRRPGLTTQKAILDSVKQSTGILELNANIWNMQLRKFVKSQLRERLKNHGVQISLAGCKSMAEVRKTIDIHYAKEQAVHKLKLDIAITLNEIIVNGTSHTITTRPSGAYKYRGVRLLVNGRRKWLDVEELKVLFGLTL